MTSSIDAFSLFCFILHLFKNDLMHFHLVKTLLLTFITYLIYKKKKLVKYKDQIYMKTSQDQYITIVDW